MIVEQTDTFDLWRWSRQALGLKGWLLGGTSFVQNKIREEGAQGTRGISPAGRVMTRIEPPFDRARLEDEWLEADGFGGFASGTVGMMRTRRYHALLLTATQPPAGRVVLVNGIEAWLDVDGARYPLTMQRYAPDVLYPDASREPAFLRYRAVADVALPRSASDAVRRRGSVRREGEPRNGIALASRRRRRARCQRTSERAPAAVGPRLSRAAS